MRVFLIILDFVETLKKRLRAKMSEYLLDHEVSVKFVFKKRGSLR